MIKFFAHVNKAFYSKKNDRMKIDEPRVCVCVLVVYMNE